MDSEPVTRSPKFSDGAGMAGPEREQVHRVQLPAHLGPALFDGSPYKPKFFSGELEAIKVLLGTRTQ